MSGYFCILKYGEIFLCSNYSDDILECINGLMLSISGLKNYYTKMPRNEYYDVNNGLLFSIYESDFIERGRRHYFRYHFETDYGNLFVFKYEINQKKIK